MTPVAILAIILVAALPVFGQAIIGVSPTSAAQGTANVLVTFTLGRNPPPPPLATLPTSVTIGTNTGRTFARTGFYTVTAVFNIAASEAVGSKNATVVFPAPPGTFTGTAVFRVTAGSGVVAGFTATPTSGTAPLAVSFTDASTGTIANRLWNFGDGTTSTANHPSHTYTRTGSYTVSLVVNGTVGSNTITRAGYVTVTGKPTPGSYGIVATGLTHCFNNTNLITAPTPGQPFYGQDAQVSGTRSSYTKSRDGLTVKDNVTGLTWQKSPDTNGDGVIDSLDKMTLAQARTHITALNAANYGGYNDWRLPTIKELQSIVDYTRSPDTTSSAAIDPLFTCTGITNEAGKADFPFYWTSTTHMSQVGGPDASAMGGGYAVYVAFGRAMGYMTGGDPRIAGWLDVHGAGAQRSDPKVGNPAFYPRGHGPQGDAIRIYNYVRLVCNADTNLNKQRP